MIQQKTQNLFGFPNNILQRCLWLTSSSDFHFSSNIQRAWICHSHIYRKKGEWTKNQLFSDSSENWGLRTNCPPDSGETGKYRETVEVILPGEEATKPVNFWKHLYGNFDELLEAGYVLALE